MKSIFQNVGSLVAILIAAAALSGCAVGQGEHLQHHPEAAAAKSSTDMGRGGSTGQMGMMGGGADGQKGMMGGGQMGMTDKKSMCEMHNKMMSSKTPEERSAMMDEHMKSMSPEMRQHHMEMMQQQCK